MNMDKQQEKVLSPVTVFYSYAPEDEYLQVQLEQHLAGLRRQRLIREWHRRKIQPGMDSDHFIASYIEEAEVILLLVSPAFLASDYCYSQELKWILNKQEMADEGYSLGFYEGAIVIPIILRPCDWKQAPFGQLQSLPRNEQPVTTWRNRDEAFNEIAKELRQIIQGLRSVNDEDDEPNPFQKTPNANTPTRRQLRLKAVSEQNRHHLLDHMQAIWINGLLNHSLHNTVLIELGFQEHSLAVENPWRFIVQEMDLPERTLPPGTTIIQIYDEAQGELLILGEPGADKTTLLLQLTRDLLKRAKKDDTHPIPVIFNLSSWSVRWAFLWSLPARFSMDDWFVEELSTRYQIPRKIGESWVSTGQIIPLLDGLDEGAPGRRVACIHAINAYRVDHGLVSVVVCSRSMEYLIQETTRLLLRTAVVVQPLTTQQVEDYLTKAGENLAALQKALHTDPTLQELARTPLMLNVLALTYQGKSLKDLPSADLSRVQQRQIFDAYVERMLARRSVDTRYTLQQTTFWLAWLARQLAKYGQGEFSIKMMHPEWLSNKSHQSFKDSVAGLEAGLVCGLVGGLIGGLLGGIIGMIAAGFLGPLAALIKKSSTANHSLAYVLAAGFLGGFVGGCIGNLTNWPIHWLIHLPFLRLLGGLSYGLAAGLTIRLSIAIKMQFSELEPDPAYVKGYLMIVGLVVLLVVGLVLGLIFGLNFGPSFVLGCLGGILLAKHGARYLRRIVLRWYLWRDGSIPWNYSRFLNFAVERILLRKVGHSYIFIHRSLLNYFATLEGSEEFYE